MMEWTDRHCRYFLRLISKATFLYTEMVTAEAVLYGDRNRVLGFSPEEHPVGLQLGGSDPNKLAAAARIGADYGYDEINLNIGCPSDRVQSGRFGACLMAEPDLVAQCVAAMGEAASLPITVKCRIGIDDQDAEESLDRFIDGVAASGRAHLHRACAQGLAEGSEPEGEPRRAAARLRARLTLEGSAGPSSRSCSMAGSSLSPARTRIWRRSTASCSAARPMPIPISWPRSIATLFGSDETPPSRLDVLDRFVPYVEAELARGARLNQMTRHILGLFHGQPRARAFRRHLAENAHFDGAGIDVLLAARRIIAGEERTAIAAE